ncbi:MAG: cation:dicarboxylase symporter family transporter, partial [Pirellulales bacterium]
MEASPVQLRPRKQRAWYGHLYLQVLTAITCGVLIGYFWPKVGVQLQPLGDGFIKLVKMVIGPVIFLTISLGIAGMGKLNEFGRVTGKALVYFLSVSSLALVVGLVVANGVQPGAGMKIDPATLDSDAVKEYVGKAQNSGIVKFLMEIIPTTFISALTEGSILQVLLVAILFGVSMVLVGPSAEPVVT